MLHRLPIQLDPPRSPGSGRSGWVCLACLLGVVALSSGCVVTGPREWIHNGFKVGPNYCRPPVPVAEEWIHTRAAHVQNRHLTDWWKVFQDSTLNSLIDTAYDQNLTLRVAGTRVLQARAQAAVAAGNLFLQKQQLTGNYYQGTVSGQPVRLDFTNFNLSWEADFWGRFRRSIESANATFDASVESYDDALVTLLGDVATNYVQYRVAQQRIKIARDNVRIQEGVLALAQEKFRVGTATRLDVEQARTVLEATRATIPAQQILQGQANDTLCTLLGIPPQDLEHMLGPGPELGIDPMPRTPDWVAVGLPADLVRRRPDVRAAERQVASQSAQIGVAEADLYPHLAVNGIIGYQSNNLPLLGSSGFLGFIVPNFSWNILTYGRILNNVRQQEARLQELIATYQNRVLTAAREVQIPLRGYLRSREQAEDLTRSVTAARAATEVGVQQYRAGTIAFNTVFQLETTQVQQQDQLATVQGNIALNLVNVYRALGGGWELRLEKDNCPRGPLVELPKPAEEPAAPKSESLPAPKRATDTK
jgi:NodT family efflux transporter outer membrane factor (OMF) lipoprotein